MSEVRLIDANALLEKLKQNLRDYRDVMNEDGACATLIAIRAVEKAPTLDYEPVVHCKDCKHRNKEYGPMFCQVLGRNTENKFYCSYGAKMDEEQK